MTSFYSGIGFILYLLLYYIFAKKSIVNLSERKMCTLKCYDWDAFYYQWDDKWDDEYKVEMTQFSHLGRWDARDAEFS